MSETGWKQITMLIRPEAHMRLKLHAVKAGQSITQTVMGRIADIIQPTADEKRKSTKGGHHEVATKN